MAEAFPQIRLMDVIDILLVTTLVYTAVVWLRRTRAGLVAVGILILGLLYLVARALDLRLTAWIFQGFFAVFLVIIVVIFQEELRQLFERLAVWGLRRGRDHPPVELDPADILVRCVADFARERIGALIVLPGRQPIQRHLQGGVELSGSLSAPLVKSLFDPHSPGHDGAMVVEGERVTRFAEHLPLSRDPGRLTGMGTRHSAALGLAELTDALSIVVSEERGTISVARDGRLRVLDDAQELTREIEALRARERRVRPPIFSLARWRENRLEKLASLALVLGLWYAFVPGARPERIVHEIPVRVANVPETLQIDRINPAKVRAVLSGPRRAFYLFNAGQLEIVLEGSELKPGNRKVEISVDNVHHPEDVTVDDLEPSSVQLSVSRGTTQRETPQGGE